ncbi:MAG: hypothetical protein ACRDEA_01060, partial [Microcystaceae cyanobacterium]
LRQVGGDRVALATLPGETASPDNFSPYPGVNPLPSSPNYSNGATTPLPGSPYSNGATTPLSPNRSPNPGQQGLGNSQLNPSNSSIPNVPIAPNRAPKKPNNPATQNLE